MNDRATRFLIRGEVAHRHEADAQLRGSGSAVLVRRGVMRSLVIACPDGCGDILTINLDERSGPAWRLYQNRGGTSLFPSVWRDNGCRSHFIVWQSKIYWCDKRGDALEGDDTTLEARVQALLGPTLKSYVALADHLGEVPWAVLVACNHLVASGKAREGSGTNRGKFQIY